MAFYLCSIHYIKTYITKWVCIVLIMTFVVDHSTKIYGYFIKVYTVFLIF